MGQSGYTLQLVIDKLNPKARSLNLYSNPVSNVQCIIKNYVKKQCFTQFMVNGIVSWLTTKHNK